jgi:type VI secretion system protein ImpK
MTLPELCEPIFSYLCRLNRMARESQTLDYSVARAELKALLQDLTLKAGESERLRAQALKMELPLVFFVDSMIAESDLPFASRWNDERLAYERDKRTGDDLFWTLLEECEQDRSDEAAERLVVFYTCLGLGFTGSRDGQPELIRTTMMTLAPRIRQWIDADQTARLFPEAYENVDTRDLVERPTRKLFIIGIVLGISAIALVVAHVWLYDQALSKLDSALTHIERQSQSSNDNWQGDVSR